MPATEVEEFLRSKAVDNIIEKKDGLVLEEIEDDPEVIPVNRKLCENEKETHEELHSNPDSSNEDDVPPVQYTNFNAERDMRQPIFERGMKFGTEKEFRETVRNYSIVSGKLVSMYTNDAVRLRTKCEKPCQWFVYTTKVPVLGSNDFVLKIMNDQHTNCIHY
ncbi:hypothetical protein ACH5RR_009388 [Cinchona calisaya]|uniref:Transposase MuDR plant domain-containing protein n=1 Tax=Cinchona calisaya TaxID=153742 RepID=A0ABD3AGI0_9GENT